MAIPEVKLNMNFFVPVKGAGTRFGLTDTDIKNINTNGDEYITALEVKNYGVSKCPELTKAFAQNPTQPVGAQVGAQNTGRQQAFTGLKAVQNSLENAYVSNPNSIKNNFSICYNKGQLSPTVDGEGSPCGQVLPRLYA